MYSPSCRTLTGAISNIRQPANIALLLLSIVLIPAFIFWETRREHLNVPALIPNSLWKNTVFTSVCLTVLFSNAVANSMEVFCSLLYVLLPFTSLPLKPSHYNNHRIASKKSNTHLPLVHLCEFCPLYWSVSSFNSPPASSSTAQAHTTSFYLLFSSALGPHSLWRSSQHIGLTGTRLSQRSSSRRCLATSCSP